MFCDTGERYGLHCYDNNCETVLRGEYESRGGKKIPLLMVYSTRAPQDADLSL